MHQMSLREVIPQIERCITENKLPEANALLWPALNQQAHISALWFYAGAIFNLEGKLSAALAAWERCYQLEPNPAVLNNIGSALRTMQRADEARQFLQRAVEHKPDDVHILSNLTGCYVNEGNPWPGIEVGERAIKLSGSESGKFNLALLHLEAGNFARGFDLYAEGQHKHRESRQYQPDPPTLTPELHAKLKGTGATIVTWGEQGIGDELMFATMLNDVIDDYEVVFECHPRLELLHRTSSWAQRLHREGRPIQITPTRKQQAIDLTGRPVAAKLAIGNLARLYRRTPESFAWKGPTYYPPYREWHQMRAHLQEIADGRVIVGLAMRGGVVETNRTYRCLRPDQLLPLLKDDRLLFVSLDYEDMAPVHDWIADQVGPDRFLWFPTVNFAWDYHHTAALVAATNCVVSVPQSVAHISAGMGHPTYLLTPSKPDWRLTVNSGSQWHWYGCPSVRLYRQSGNNWDPAISAVHDAVQAHFIPKLEATA